MLLHLGRGVSLRSGCILAMIDLQQPLSRDTEKLLQSLQGRSLLRQLGPSPKTAVLYTDAGQTRCMMSCVGLRTLRKRAEGWPLPDENEVQND